MNEQKRHIETVLSAMLAARKCVQLYPSGNPTITQALNMLHQRLAEWFEGRYAPEPEGAPSPDFHITVERDLFQIAGDAYSPDNATVRRFAAEIYRLGVKALRISEGVSLEELHTALRVLGQTADILEADGGLLAIFARLGMEHVHVEAAEVFRISRDIESGTEADMVDYLTQREQTHHGTSGPASASLIADFFLELAEGSQEVEASLRNTLSSPEKAAALLSHIDQREHETAGDAAQSCKAVRQTLAHIRNAMNGFSSDVRTRYLQNLADAMMNVSSSSGERSASTLLAPGIGHGEIEDELLSLCDESFMTETLAEQVVVHDGTADTVSNFLRDYVADPELGERVKKAVARRIASEGDAHLDAIAKALEGEAVTPAESASNRTSRDKVCEQRERICQALHITTDQIQALANRAENETEHQCDAYVARMALRLFEDVPADVVTPGLLDTMAAGIAAIWKSGDYRGVREMLVASRGTKAALVDGVRPLLANPVYMDELVEALRASETGGREDIIALLRQIGSPSVKTLFERLVSEKNRSMRLFIIGILSEFGEDIVPFLTTQVASRPWYVLRNVTLLLGKSRSESAVPVLEQIITHSDKRVRLEVLEALALIKGPRAEDILVKSLKDASPTVAGAAAQWLGKCGAERAVASLVELLAAGRDRLYKEPSVAQGVLAALGLLGGCEHCTVIESFRPPWWLRLGKKRRELDKACSEAITQIERRTAPQTQGADRAYV